MLMALDAYLGPTPEIAILGSGNRAETREVLADLNRRFLPNKVVAVRADGRSTGAGSPALCGIFEGKAPFAPGPTVFVCEDFACQSPVSGKEAAVAKFAALEADAEAR
jgi:uncharacterized protein YyaL (SSP411 family)